MAENTIQNELNSLIAKMSASPAPKSNAESPFTPVLDAQGNPLPEPVAPAATETVPAAPATTPVAVTPTVTPSAVEPGIFEDWDGTPNATPTEVVPQTPTVTPQVDFTEIAKALGKDDLKSKDEIAREIAALKSVAETIESAPEDLITAVKLAKIGGDYLDYLKVSSINWEKEDPIDLYVNYVEDQFIDPATGNVDYEKSDAILDKMDDSEKEFRGRELQRQYIAHQKQQQQILQQAAFARKAQFEQSVQAAVSELKDVNGFVLSPAKKTELLQYVLSGEDLKETDVKTRVINAFIKKNFNAIDSYLKTKIKNTTTRALLEEAQVPQLKQTAQTVETSGNKTYSVQDYIQDLKKQRGF